MEIIRSELVGSRSDLARICNEKEIKLAVEVGVDRGQFALEFLNKWHGETLFCIDTWESYAEMPYDRTMDMIAASIALKDHINRVKFMRVDSARAATIFRTAPNWPRKVGFVYIDANHEYQSVKEDLFLWWMILQEGGILAGDDFDESHTGVVAAVKEFARTQGKDIRLTTDYNRGASWYIHK